MNRLTSRLAKLERGYGGGNCAMCKGLGRAGFTFRFSTEPEPPAYGGCDRCGRVSAVHRKIVNMPDGFDVNAAFPRVVRIPCT